MSLIGSQQVEQSHYHGWLLAGKLAEWLGMDVGVITHEETNTYALVIELPSGQVHKVIPGYMMEGSWKSFDKDKVEDRSRTDQFKAVADCLNGILVHRHTLVIPDKKEETE